MANIRLPAGRLRLDDLGRWQAAIVVESLDTVRGTYTHISLEARTGAAAFAEIANIALVAGQSTYVHTPAAADDTYDYRYRFQAGAVFSPYSPVWSGPQGYSLKAIRENLLANRGLGLVGTNTGVANNQITDANNLSAQRADVHKGAWALITSGLRAGESRVVTASTVGGVATLASALSGVLANGDGYNLILRGILPGKLNSLISEAAKKCWARDRAYLSVPASTARVDLPEYIRTKDQIIEVSLANDLNDDERPAPLVWFDVAYDSSRGPTLMVSAEAEGKIIAVDCYRRCQALSADTDYANADWDLLEAASMVEVLEHLTASPYKDTGEDAQKLKGWKLKMRQCQERATAREGGRTLMQTYYTGPESYEH